MQILSEILLQYKHNHNQFYILYCHVFGDAHALPVISLYWTSLIHR